MTGKKINRAMSSSREIRLGEKGSFCYYRDKGNWQDFSSGKSGSDLIALVQETCGMSFREALKESSDLSGVPALVQVSRKQAEKEPATVPGQESRIQRVRHLHQRCGEFASDDIGVRYLAKRGIDNLTNLNTEDMGINAGLWSKDVARKLPALIFFARNAAGKVTGCQQVMLNRETGNKAEVNIAKRSAGKISGSFVSLNKSDSKVVLIAEGAETALSLHQAGVPGRILCSLGSSNLKNYKPQPGEKIILCGDNDGKDAQAMQATEKAAAKYRELGVEVKVVVPAGKEKADWNDVLCKEGAAEIRRQIEPVICQVEPEMEKMLQEW